MNDWNKVQLEYMNSNGIKDLDNLKHTRSRHELEERQVKEPQFQVERSSSQINQSRVSDEIPRHQLRHNSKSPYISKKSINAEDPDLDYNYLD